MKRVIFRDPVILYGILDIYPFSERFSRGEVVIFQRNVELLMNHYDVNLPSQVPFAGRSFEIIEKHGENDYLVKPEETGFNVLVRDNHAEMALSLPEELFEL